MHLKLYVNLVVPLLATALMIAIPLAENAASGPSKASEQPITVEVTRISPQTTQDILLLPGKTESPSTATIVTDIEAVVTACPAYLGAPLKSQDVICKLRSKDPGFTDREVALRTPVAGAVAELLVAPGGTVTRGTIIAKVVPVGSERFVVHAPFADAQRIKPGQTAVLESLEGQPLAAMNTLTQQGGPSSEQGSPSNPSLRCVAKSPTADPTTATVRTEWAPVEARSGLLNHVQLARIRIVTASREAVRIPAAAVRYEGGKPFARLVKDGTIELASLVLGPSDGEMIEVKAGLAAGDMVVVRASRYIKAGDKVTVEDSPQAPRAQK